MMTNTEMTGMSTGLMSGNLTNTTGFVSGTTMMPNQSGIGLNSGLSTMSGTTTGMMTEMPMTTTTGGMMSQPVSTKVCTNCPTTGTTIVGENNSYEPVRTGTLGYELQQGIKDLKQGIQQPLIGTTGMTTGMTTGLSGMSTGMSGTTTGLTTGCTTCNTSGMMTEGQNIPMSSMMNQGLVGQNLNQQSTLERMEGKIERGVDKLLGHQQGYGNQTSFGNQSGYGN
jgi:hypothetical protein